MDATAELTVDSMAVNLSSAGGTMLLNADIIVLGQEVRLRPGRNIVRFEIDAVPLAPGTYACGLWLGPSRGGPRRPWIDSPLSRQHKAHFAASAHHGTFVSRGVAAAS